MFDADESAELLLFCEAELEPSLTSPPAIAVGVLAFTPFWSAHAEESASWLVLAFWKSACAWPEPPQPTPQLSLLVCVWSASWLVSAEFEASELAELSRVWFAELSPPETSPPAIETGTLALTPFCLAPAFELASWSVVASCDRYWACPDPPQPARQLELLDCDWSADWSVVASFDAVESAELLLRWVAALVPPDTSPPAMDTGTLALTPF